MVVFTENSHALKKAEKMARDAGFTPRAVPIKLLFLLLKAHRPKKVTSHRLKAKAFLTGCKPCSGHRGIDQRRVLEPIFEADKIRMPMVIGRAITLRVC